MWVMIMIFVVGMGRIIDNINININITIKEEKMIGIIQMAMVIMKVD